MIGLCVCGHGKLAHYFETACSFEDCDCVMFEEPKQMIDPNCDCTVGQQDRCAVRAEPFHNPSTFRCKVLSEPTAPKERECRHCGRPIASCCCVEQNGKSSHL